MAQWVHVCDAPDCPPGSAIEVVAEQRMVALFNVEGSFHALDGVCPHQGGPLGKGHLEGCIVTCPWHGWQFDVRNGKSQLSDSVMQPQIPVKLEQEQVFVEI